jgi:hypothetical protein
MTAESDDPAGSPRRVFRISALTGAGLVQLTGALMTRLEQLAAEAAVEEDPTDAKHAEEDPASGLTSS